MGIWAPFLVQVEHHEAPVPNCSHALSKSGPALCFDLQRVLFHLKKAGLAARRTEQSNIEFDRLPMLHIPHQPSPYHALNGK